MTMRNDATRLRIATTDRRRPRAVVARQGQVLLDTDIDQQARHHIDRLEIETVDTLGSPGRLLVPAGDDGFLITPDATPANFDIGSGHGYLDGWLVENPATCKLATQPHPRTDDAVTLPAVVGIKVLVRYVDPAEEPVLADVALGDAQASGRALIDWQVFPLSPAGAASLTCANVTSDPVWQSLVGPSTGTLKVIESSAAPSTDPCSLTPGGGYSRLENLLYRVEVHGGATDAAFPTIDGPRFQLDGLKLKFSRRNASTLVRIAAIAGPAITVTPPALDARNWFAPGLYAEIVSVHDDVDPRAAVATERLFRVAQASDDLVVLEATVAEITATAAAADDTWFLRLWDGFPGGVAVVQAPAGATESAEISLGDGLTIVLGAGASATTFRRGDYWTFSARADGTIDWPTTAGVADALTPHGPEVRYAPLATINIPALTPVAEDCRVPFATLSDRVLLYRGGDGQGVFAPSGTGTVPLPSKLRVAVMRGETPVAGATVRWSFLEPAGGSYLIDGAVCDAANSPEIVTDADGLGEVTWSIDTAALLDVHKVQAVLVTGAAATSRPPLVFSAAFATAARTGYTPGACADLAGVHNVQEALDHLCARTHGGGCCVSVGRGGEFETLDEALRKLIEKGERDICICLLPGDHKLAGDVEVKHPDVRLLIHGAGRGSRLDLAGQSFALAELAALTLRDFDIVDQGRRNVIVESCADVVVSGMRIYGLADKASVLHIGTASTIELTASQIVAYTLEGVKRAVTMVNGLAGLKEFAVALRPEGNALFARPNRKLVETLAAVKVEVRKKTMEQINALVASGTLAAEEQEAFTTLRSEMSEPEPVRFGLALEQVREALLLTQAGAAVTAGTGATVTLVADCHIGGRLSVCGAANAAQPLLSEESIKALATMLKSGAVTLQSATGDLRLRNNRLRDVRIGDDMMRGVLTVIHAARGPIAGVLRSLIADANVMKGPPSELMAVDLALSLNVLVPFSDVGTAVSTQAKYIGNFAHNDFRLFHVGGLAHQSFGNGALNIVNA